MTIKEPQRNATKILSSAKTQPNIQIDLSTEDMRAGENLIKQNKNRLSVRKAEDMPR